MSAEEFDIVFRGDIVLGHQLTQVKQRLQQLFKSDAERVEALFTGRPVVLKRNLDRETAEKYRDALFKAGAQTTISPAGSVAAKAAAPAAPVARKPVWSLAPAGSYLLAPSERRVFTPLDLDVSRLTLRPAGEPLLDASEQPPAPEAPEVAAEFDLAEVGADLLAPEERPELPLVAYEAGDWDLAEVGADLLTEEERPQPEAPPIAVGDYGLAPVGSDLGQLKPEVKPLVPDISRLSLVEPE
jgi:hypothetical protein